MTWPDSSSLALAVGAGLVAAVNPCGFALLPAYLSVFVLEEATSSRTAAVARALRATAALTLGFAGVFLIFGLAIAPFAASVQIWLPFFTVALGAVLAAVGLWVLAGRQLPALPMPHVRKRKRAGISTSWPAMTGFGASYAIASLGCTIAPFLAVVVTAFRAGSLTSGIMLFGAYALAMGAVVGSAAVAVALARDGLITRLRRSGRAMHRIGGGVLALAGTYVAWYGAWELRVLHLGSDETDHVVTAAGNLQRWLADSAETIGILGFGVVIAALTGFAAITRRRRSRAVSTPAPAEEKS